MLNRDVNRSTAVSVAWRADAFALRGASKLSRAWVKGRRAEWYDWGVFNSASAVHVATRQRSSSARAAVVSTGTSWGQKTACQPANTAVIE